MPEIAPYTCQDLLPEQVAAWFRNQFRESAEQVLQARTNHLRSTAAHAAVVAEEESAYGPLEGQSSGQAAEHRDAALRESEAVILAQWVHLKRIEAAHAALVAERDRLLTSRADQ